MKITWRKDSVYIEGHYCGYIDPIGENGGWYGNIICKNDWRAMTHFELTYDRKAIKREIVAFIKANYDKVLADCIRVENLNKK